MINASSITVKDVTIDGGGDAGGIYVSAGDGILIENVTIHNALRAGIHMTTGGTDRTIKGCTIDGVDVVVGDKYADGIYWVGNSRVICTGNRISNIRGRIGIVSEGASATDGVKSTDVLIANNSVRDVSESRTTITSGEAAVNVGGGVVGIPVASHHYTTGSTLSIIGTTNYNGAITVLASSTATQINITAAYVAEVFGDNAKLHDTEYNAGIWVENTTSAIITGNITRSTNEFGIIVAQSNIVPASNYGRIVISDNQIYGSEIGIVIGDTEITMDYNVHDNQIHNFRSGIAFWGARKCDIARTQFHAHQQGDTPSSLSGTATRQGMVCDALFYISPGEVAGGVSPLLRIDGASKNRIAVNGFFTDIYLGYQVAGNGLLTLQNLASTTTPKASIYDPWKICSVNEAADVWKQIRIENSSISATATNISVLMFASPDVEVMNSWVYAQAANKSEVWQNGSTAAKTTKFTNCSITGCFDYDTNLGTAGHMKFVGCTFASNVLFAAISQGWWWFDQCMNYTSASVDIIAFTGAGAKALKMMNCYWYTGSAGTTYLANLGAAAGFAYTMLHDNLYHGPDSVASGAVTSNADNISY